MLNFDWLNDMNLLVAKILLLAVFVASFLFSLFFKKKYIYAGAPDKKNWRNLKYWVFLLVAIMISIYIIF